MGIAKRVLGLFICVGAFFFVGEVRADERQVVALTTSPLIKEDKPDQENPIFPRILIRELWRQAVLLTAREEFGCATRDQSLAEPLPIDADVQFSAIVEPRHRLGTRLILKVDEQTLIDVEHKHDVGPVYDFKDLNEFLAPLTRTELVDALASQGLDRRTIERHDSAALPEEVEALLLSTSYVAQHRAVRAIHREIRESGESPERLAGLARGYANLAQYTLTTLDARSFAYLSRAILYAERLRHYYPDRPESFWCTAYVYHLGGYLTTALDYLKKAQELSPDAILPAWVQLVDDACHHRYDALLKVAGDENNELQELGMLFLFRSAFASANSSMVVAMAQLALREVPHCLTITDLLHAAVGVSLRHRTSVMGPPLHGAMLASELPALEELPDTTAKLLDEAEALDFRSIAKIARTLIDAAGEDRDEPSLAVLGADIEAWNVLHIFRRGDFLRNNLGSDASQFMKVCEPAIADNAWAPMLRTLAIAPTARPEPFERAIGDFQYLDSNKLSSRYLFSRIPATVKFGELTAAAVDMTAQYGGTLHEFEAVLRLKYTGDRELRLQNAKWMLDSSPHAPVRIAVLLRDDESLSADQRAKWEEEHGGNPTVAAAMGEYYARQGQTERAIELLEQSLRVLPDPANSRALATVYYHQDDEKWIATLARVLDQPDYALDHAAATCAIAATMMRDGEYAEALPWAQRAAEDSGAGWAMKLECDCRTLLGQWDEAEAIARQNTERYDNMEWYLWCVDTGKGDLAGAWSAKRALLKARFEAGHREHEFAQTVHQLALGNDDECLKTLLARADRTRKANDMFMIVVLADNAHNTALRDTWLANMSSLVNAEPPDPLFKLAPAFQQVIAAGDGNLDAINSAIDELTKIHTAYGVRARYYAGHYCLNNVSAEAAIEMWKPAAASPDSSDNDLRSLVRMSLREAGVALDEIENMEFPYALPARPE